MGIGEPVLTEYWGLFGCRNAAYSSPSPRGWRSKFSAREQRAFSVLDVRIESALAVVLRSRQESFAVDRVTVKFGQAGLKEAGAPAGSWTRTDAGAPSSRRYSAVANVA